MVYDPRISRIEKKYLPKKDKNFSTFTALWQGSQTRGPPDAFVRPANILKTDKSINFDQIFLIFY